MNTIDSNELIQRIQECVDFWKANKDTPYPPNMRRPDGAGELTKLKLKKGIKPAVTFNLALITIMEKIGEKFSLKKMVYTLTLLVCTAN